MVAALGIGRRSGGVLAGPGPGAKQGRSGKISADSEGPTNAQKHGGLKYYGYSGRCYNSWISMLVYDSGNDRLSLQNIYENFRRITPNDLFWATFDIPPRGTAPAA